jgi:hypothetical protein
MFKWIERKILRPVVKRVEKNIKPILGLGAAAALGPVAGATMGKLTVSAATKTALLSGAANVAGAVLTRNDARKENNRVLAANKAEAQRVQKINEQAVEKAQKQNTEVRENYYKNVVEDAQAAGINPLTALRTGGGQGYATAVAGTMNNAVLMEGVYATPTLTRNPLAAGLEAGTNIYLQELTRQKQYSHETRMDELNRSLKKAQIKSMTGDLIDYTGYNQGDGVPVKFGLQDFVVPLEIAKRLRIAPNDYVEAGVIQELFGEASEIFTAFAQSGYNHMYGIYTPNLLGSRNDRKDQHGYNYAGKRGDRKRARIQVNRPDHWD